MTPLIAFLPIFTLCVLSSNIGSIFITVYGDCEVEVGGKLSASKNTIPSFFGKSNAMAYFETMLFKIICNHIECK